MAGELLQQEMRRQWRHGVEAPLKMRAALVELLSHLLQWHGRAGTNDASDAAQALLLIRALFETVATAVGMPPEELEPFLSLPQRKASVIPAPPPLRRIQKDW